MITLNKKYNYILTVVIIILSVATIIISAALYTEATKHIHTFGDWEEYKPATCSQYGVERRFCDCGEVQEKNINKTKHTDGDWVINDDANEKTLSCSVCGKILEVVSLENHTHSFGDWVVEIEPTCTLGGLMSRSCRCGFKQEKAIATTNHNYGQWTVVKEPECEVEGLKERVCSCGKIETITLDALAHLYGEWQITTPAKCGIEGEESRFCTCGKAETRPIDALQHVEGYWNIVDNIKTYYCQYCDKALREETIAIASNLDIVDGVVLGMGDCTDTDIKIPASFDGAPVTSIDKKAFYNDSSITSVEIPSGVTSIGPRAFGYCKNLQSSTLPSTLEIIGTWAFEYCSSLTSIHFDGTIDEWNALTTDTDWDLGMKNYTVYCTDGNITK